MKYIIILLSVINILLSTSINGQIAPVRKSSTTIKQPILTTKQAIILENATKNLQLDNVTIKSISFKSLNDVAALLTRKPDWKLRIDGHTNSTSLSASDRNLLKRQLYAIQAYLVQKGVARDRFILNWGGEHNNFMSSGNTQSAKANNRRVEFVVLQQD